MKFLFFCHDEIRVLCFTRSSSFLYIHVSVDIKSNVEKDSTLLFFLFKCPGGHTISCHLKPWVAFGMPYLLVCLWCGWVSGHVTFTFLGCIIGNQIFLPMVLRFYIKQFLQFTGLESCIFIVKGLNPGVISYKVGWAWLSGWTWSWIGLLLLTVTDVSKTFAVVIFKVQVRCITLVDVIRPWSSRDVIGCLLVKRWSYWLWRLVMSLMRFNPSIITVKQSK